MGKRRFEPEVNSWVEIVNPKRSPAWSGRQCWTDSVPAFVTRIMNHSLLQVSQVSVIVPNMLVLQCGFKGEPYIIYNDLSLCKVRPYQGKERTQLTQALLQAFASAGRYDVSCLKSWPQTEKRDGQVMLSSHDAPCLQDLIDVLPDFAGMLIEFLWKQVNFGEARVEIVTAADCLPIDPKECHREHSILVPAVEYSAFQLLRTGSSMCAQMINGIKLRRRVVSDPGVSLRLISMISGGTREAFPLQWKKSRRLQLAPTLGDEEQDMDEESCADFRRVMRSRRDALRGKLAEQSMTYMEASMHGEWRTMVKASEQMIDKVTEWVLTAFSKSWGIDPYAVGVHLSEILSIGGYTLADYEDPQSTVSRALGDALIALHKRRKIALIGHVVFPL